MPTDDTTVSNCCKTATLTGKVFWLPARYIAFLIDASSQIFMTKTPKIQKERNAECNMTLYKIVFATIPNDTTEKDA